jgi:hypothetical protein
LAAARATVGAGLLADLVDHSLVEAHEVDGHTRYRLLETVREYGRERLADDAEETAHRYGQWVARLVESVGANAQLDTPTWYGLLDRGVPAPAGRLRRGHARRDAETALRIASGSGWALIIIGRFHRLREWLREALALARETDVDDRVLAQGLMMAGAVAGIDHRFDGTLDLLSEARQRFEAVGTSRARSGRATGVPPRSARWVSSRPRCRRSSTPRTRRPATGWRSSRPTPGPSRPS